MARPTAEQVQARKAEIRWRYKQKRRPVNFTRLRLSELNRLRTARYPNGIPATPDGLVMVRVLIHHLSIAGGYGEPKRRLERMLGELAPWMSLAEAKTLVADALTRPRRWRADKLAWRLKLLEADRAALRITTIGAVDLSKADRAVRRKTVARERRQAKRRAAGAKSRKEYEANAISHAKPWIAEGISRATWYRRAKRAGNETSAAPA